MTPHLCRLAREASSLGGGDEVLRQRSEQWPRFRGLVVPMLIGMVGCSSSTRAKLWAADGADVFLLLLREQVCVGGRQAVGGRRGGLTSSCCCSGIRCVAIGVFGGEYEGGMGGDQRGNPLPPLFITAHHLPPAQSVLPLHASVTPAPACPPSPPLYRIQACKQACCRHWTHGWARI